MSAPSPAGPERGGGARPPGPALEDVVREHLAAGRVDEAAAALIEELGPEVRGYLCALHGDDDGEDVHSLWCELVWRSLPGFRFEGALRAWSYRVAWSASGRHRRDAWRVRRVRLPTSIASRLAASRSRASRGAARDDRLDELRRGLSPRDHTLLILKVDRELTFEEVSAVLSAGGRAVSAVALRKRFERLKERLAREAQRKGLLP